MTLEIGDRPLGSVLIIPWTTRNAVGAGASRSTNGTINIYKDDEVTPLTNDGVTDTEDFNSVVGLNLLEVDTDPVTNDYTSDGDYYAVLEGAEIGGSPVAPEVIARWSLGLNDVYAARIAMVRQSATVNVYSIEIVRNGVTLPFASFDTPILKVYEVLNALGSASGTVVINNKTPLQVTAEASMYYRATSTSGAGGSSEVVTPGQMYRAKLTFNHTDIRDSITVWAEVIYKDA
jgi:hypothetical protein